MTFSARFNLVPSGVNADSPQVNTAVNECQHLLPPSSTEVFRLNGEGMCQARLARLRAKELAFSKCMRAPLSRIRRGSRPGSSNASRCCACATGRL